MDRISSLPDEIICQIVCFLSAKEAAFTTVLSKRWQNVFSIIPSLQFCDDNDGNITDFLNGVLALPASSRIRNFSVSFKRFDPEQCDHVNHCLCHMLKRGIIDLKVNIYGDDDESKYSLPSEVLTSKTIFKLELGFCVIVDVLPENAILPALEILVLQYCDCAYDKLLAACPVLKVLFIYGMKCGLWEWSGNLSSPTLERLFLEEGFTTITLDTPSLTYLEFYDLVPNEYPIVNLDSLVQANVDLVLTGYNMYEDFVDQDHSISTNPKNLITTLRNVRILNLLSSTTLQAFSYFKEALPVFENLSDLTITIDDPDECWSFLPFLLKNSPKIDTLVIDGQLHYDEKKTKSSVCDCLLGYSFLLSCPIKVLKITDYYDNKEEVEQLKHFIEKLSCLELVQLRCRSDSEKLMLPRAPSNCKIEVTFD